MPKRIVVIGAVALGPKAACRLKRLDPTAQVTMIDSDDIVSYGGCGIPYYISGDVSDIKELRTTSFKMVRDEKFFENTKGIEVRTRIRAKAVHRDRKVVEATDLTTGQNFELPYDQLVLATGATPRRLGLPGEDLPGVFTVANLHDASALRDMVSSGGVGSVVVVGSGFIGLEMAEALADMWGLDVAVVEVMNQVLPKNVSPDLARMVSAHLVEKGVALHLGEQVVRFEGQGKVARVITDKRELAADLVICSAGVIPNSALAQSAGLACSPRGGVLVDATMRTSDPDIFSGGDCVEVTHLVTGKPFFLPLGSMANRQGRVIGTNLAGGNDVFAGAVGSFAVKVFDRSVCGAGLTVQQALQEGYDALGVLAIQLDRAHFYPGKELMTLELVVDKATRKVLGIQGFGPSGDALAGRVGAVAGLMAKGALVEDVSNLEYPYSPPFASAMDVVNTLGNVADNMLRGMNKGLSASQFERLFADNPSGQVCFLDCREPDNAQPYLERHPKAWNNIPQGTLRANLAAVPKDRPVVLVCNTGGRSYEAQITLCEAGFDNVLNLHGGMAALKQSAIDV